MEGKVRGRGRNKRHWTWQEVEVLLQALLEVSQNPNWKSENDFKSGFMNWLDEMIVAKIPRCDLKVKPHIESRLKHRSEKYCVMAEMLATSGFGWDDEKMLLQVRKSVYDELIKVSLSTFYLICCLLLICYFFSQMINFVDVWETCQHPSYTHQFHTQSLTKTRTKQQQTTHLTKNKATNK